MMIYGAGLSGLLAGCMFQNAQLLDSAPGPRNSHRALLRFRSSAVGDSVGIDFRKVLVRKGIWYDGGFVLPTIRLANMYSQKTIGMLLDRSIWDVASVERYIAPEDFYDHLLERCAPRIAWGITASAGDFAQHAQYGPVISTIPMRTMAKIFDYADVPAFTYASIAVRRFRVIDCDVNQTIYFPSSSTSLYRVSITGSLMIAEYAGQADEYDFWPAFGLNSGQAELIDNARQAFGKIAPIDDVWRKKFIFKLSHEHNIFSLGRFGIWKNILLDDVLHDLQVIKKLIAGSSYSNKMLSL